MKITLLTVGKIKEKYLKDAIAEYSKRLSKYCKLEIIEVADEKTPDGAGEALEAAGGYTEEADREYVNLAAKVADGQKLYFPAQGEVLPAAEAEESDGRVNINTASVEELCSLPGIGESRALDIIHYRENAGGFQTCEDIMKVSGIKTSVYNKIKDRIKVD